MPKKQRPRVLIIDDNETDVAPLSGLLETHGRVTVTVLHPEGVEFDDVLSADLVLVDYLLDNWPLRDELHSVCLKPPDGLALAGLLRRTLRQKD